MRPGRDKDFTHQSSTSGILTTPYTWLNKSLETIHRANWYREVKAIAGNGAVVELLGKPVINFASNDYLGLAGDKRLSIAAIEAIKTYGTGSTGSRLLSGHRELHQQLEKAIASWKKTEAALVYSSGYLANLGTISALVGKKDLILGDQYNHSSLKQGAILSGATILDYQHNDLADLRHKLTTHRPLYRRCLITTDSVFSMDGDLCPLPELKAIAQEFNCMLLIDEAHATGVMGKTGAGCVEHFNCTGKEIIQIGTLSKALGSLGGYVAGSEVLIDFLRNRSATWIYTTALSPADTAAAMAAINIIQQQPTIREQLWDNINYLKQQLENLNILPSESPILCVPFATPTEALNKTQQLLDAGIFVPAIRPPTVPTSRLRISLMATQTRSHLDLLIKNLVN
ncbi:8-amino-7-oxononanoate synthase [Chondrocystis sp. NIES-4102]|nr:8-amino-7-oxononanoate synthase [Chondrocystis sp. NIES-4102]